MIMSDTTSTEKNRDKTNLDRLRRSLKNMGKEATIAYGYIEPARKQLRDQAYREKCEETSRLLQSIVFSSSVFLVLVDLLEEKLEEEARDDHGENNPD